MLAPPGARGVADATRMEPISGVPSSGLPSSGSALSNVMDRGRHHRTRGSSIRRHQVSEQRLIGGSNRPGPADLVPEAISLAIENAEQHPHRSHFSVCGITVVSPVDLVQPQASPAGESVAASVCDNDPAPGAMRRRGLSPVLAVIGGPIAQTSQARTFTPPGTDQTRVPEVEPWVPHPARRWLSRLIQGRLSVVHRLEASHKPPWWVVVLRCQYSPPWWAQHGPCDEFHSVNASGVLTLVWQRAG